MSTLPKRAMMLNMKRRRCPDRYVQPIDKLPRRLSIGGVVSSPNGVRTRVSTLRGWCPRPLDDGAAVLLLHHGETTVQLGGKDSNPE